MNLAMLIGDASVSGTLFHIRPYRKCGPSQIDGFGNRVYETIAVPNEQSTTRAIPER